MDPGTAMMAASVASNILGGIGSRKAAGRQIQAYNEATNILNQQYGRDRPLYDPYIKVGENALSRLANFGPEQLYADPGYLFRMNQGNRYAQGMANAGGRGLNSGNSLSSLLNFNQNLASQEYGNAFNRQLGLAGQGQFGVTGAVGLGSQLSNNLANLRIGRGGAEAQRSSALWNAGANALGSVGNVYALQGMGYLQNQPGAQPNYMGANTGATNQPFGIKF